MQNKMESLGLVCLMEIGFFFCVLSCSNLPSNTDATDAWCLLVFHKIAIVSPSQMLFFFLAERQSEWSRCSERSETFSQTEKHLAAQKRLFPRIE